MTKTMGFKFDLVFFLLFIIGFIALWILGDYLLTACLLGKGFIFSALRDILFPTTFATPFAVFTQLLKTN